jgi:hypothetical protein
MTGGKDLLADKTVKQFANIDEEWISGRLVEGVNVRKGESRGLLK